MLANINVANFKRVLPIGLAAAMLAVVLTYVLAAPTLIQTPEAETGHNLFMSLVRGIIGPFMSLSQLHGSMAQMHGGQPSDSQMQGMSGSEMQRTMGLIGNNILGSPATLPAGGLAVIVTMSSIVLAVAAFVVSWKHKSFVVAGLLSAGGAILMILPLSNMNFIIPGPVIGVASGLGILVLGIVRVSERQNPCLEPN